MYESLESFQADVSACADYYKDALPRTIATAYDIYRRVKGGTTLKDVDGHDVEAGITVVGRLTCDWETGRWRPSDEQFPGIDEIMKENLTTMGEDSGSVGIVLSASDWHLLTNDAWLLGGIHAGTEFHFASPLSWENLWSQKSGAMTVTAREAICISSAGYQVVRPNPKLEAVAVRTDPNTANRSSLLSLKQAVSRHSDLEALQQFFRGVPEAARRYA